MLPREPPGESPPSKSTCKVPAPVVQVSPLAQLSAANTGSAPVEPTKSCPLVPAARGVMASVPEPTNTPWSRRVLAPVPPFATVSALVRLSVPIVPVVDQKVGSVAYVVEALVVVKLVTFPVVPQKVGKVV